MLKIVLAGTPKFAVPIFEEIIKNFNVLAIISQPDKPSIRGHKILPTATKSLAKKYNIKCFQPNKIADIENELKSLGYDYLITAAFGQYIPTKILNIAKKMNLNVHGSLLPKYRGASPIQYSLLNGEKETGISLMEMVKEMDAGDIFAKLTYKIEEYDTADILFEKLSILSSKKIVKWIKDLDNNLLTREKQDSNLITLAPKLNKEDAFLSSNLKKQEALNKIKAFSSNPGCYLFLNNRRLKIFLATDREVKNTIKIDFEDGPIYLLDYQFESKKRIKLI
ncbi:methionyl-tRNA formyltransferase [Mycoplasmopsis meleagridis]|uniref:methionyl-tRNA formyltransferase n=1 Tax=Mycoplasmopsis meleagridis TaxID=29561 RepID=UPI00073D3669|nr:methionyl-tRNA formyltransferase [Mycoplasmopsis meleagridis]KUH47553.1 methionyl-tRNA formyltransferase [Mycoplasmopsis meleagridis]